VTAKDKGTGKEHQIRIQASGGLSDADIDRMVKEAEANAESDKRQREAIEAKNQAESLIHSTEKSLKDYGDKVSEADRTAIEIVSEAERDADIIRGESDAERNSILADAFTKDQEFFLFLRSMQAYKTSLTGDNATLMVEPDSEFFDYLSSPSGRPAVAPDPAESGAGGNG